MKKIINFSLNNKFAVWILTIMVIVAGLFSGLNMKQEAMPDITMPNVSIITIYPGASPDEVADKVSIPIEERTQDLKGVKHVSSSSLANISSVQIQFDFDTDMEVATNEVKEALSNLSLPEETEDPKVTRSSLNAFPVIALNISSSEYSLGDLTTMLERDVLPTLEGLEGVSDVQITGQQMKKVSIDFDEGQLDKYGLTKETVEQLIKGSDLTYPLGLTTFDRKVKNLVIDGDIETVDDLKITEIPIISSLGNISEGQQEFLSKQDKSAQSQQNMTQEQTNQQGQTVEEIPTVQLDKLADIQIVEETESISRTNGKDSISIQIVKASDANTVEVVNRVKNTIDLFEDDFGLTVTSTFDQGTSIEESISMMLDKALYGILFAIVIILLFLRSIKTTFISIVSIPLSLLIAIFMLHQMDITLNILTLGALTVAIGRVIDDSIVVMENIYRRMSLPDEKLGGKNLIKEATRQMFSPIASSTIVTIAVFLPIGFVQGQVGEMFLPFALAVVFALAASLLVAVTIVPMLAHSLFKKHLYKDDTKVNLKLSEKPSKIARFYKRILNWTLNHKLITFGGAVILLIMSFFLLPSIGVNFLPDEEEKMVMATYTPAPGQTKDETQEIALDAEQFISNRDGVINYQYSLGGDSPMDSLTGTGGGNSALYFIEYDKDFKNFNEESIKIIDILNKNTESGEWKTLDFASFGASGLELFVYGDNSEDIQTAVNQILPILEGNIELEKVESSISEAYDQYTLVANQKKLSQLGLTAAQVGMQLDDTGKLPILTTVNHEGKDLNVYIEVEEKKYNEIKDLKDIEIESPLGTTVKVRDVMDVMEGKLPNTIERRKGKMYASLSANIKGKDAAGVSTQVENKISEQDLPNGVKVEFGGVTEEINESFTQLGLAILAAIAIVYFVLVVTFGGAWAPFAILFSLPFTIIGSLFALWISNEPLSVSAMIGALMLIGIVVTNAIVLIDRVIHKEKEGLSTREALLEAGPTRLRPILMTALATIGALIPLAFGIEGGGLISKGLGITVIGGLTSSTLLTLVIVPIVYEVLAKVRKKSISNK